jgi:prepilin-type N-terminal cleavage/methylation domain-containing protein
MKNGFTLIEILVSLAIITTVGMIIIKSTNSSLNIVGVLKEKSNSALLMSYMPLDSYSSKNKKVYLEKIARFRDDDARLYLKENSGTYSNRREKLDPFSKNIAKKNLQKDNNNSRATALPFDITITEHTFKNKNNNNLSSIHTIKFKL